MWVCGLKHIARRQENTRKVTPYVGVWIETLIILFSYRQYYVTPYVGVWIETWHLIPV